MILGAIDKVLAATVTLRISPGAKLSTAAFGEEKQ
jgi:hypothetical protein